MKYQKYSNSSILTVTSCFPFNNCQAPGPLLGPGQGPGQGPGAGPGPGHGPGQCP